MDEQKVSRAGSKGSFPAEAAPGHQPGFASAVLLWHHRWLCPLPGLSVCSGHSGQLKTEANGVELCV